MSQQGLIENVFFFLSKGHVRFLRVCLEIKLDSKYEYYLEFSHSGVPNLQDKRAGMSKKKCGHSFFFFKKK